MKMQAEYAKESKQVAIGILTEIFKSLKEETPDEFAGEELYRFLEQFQEVSFRHGARVASAMIKGQRPDPPNMEIMINETIEALGADPQVFQPGYKKDSSEWDRLMSLPDSIDGPI